MKTFGKAQEASGGTLVSWAYTDLKLYLFSVENKTFTEFKHVEPMIHVAFEVVG